MKMTRESTTSPRRSTRRSVVMPFLQSTETKDKLIKTETKHKRIKTEAKHKRNKVENTVVKRPFKCSLCPKVFVVQASLRRHFKKKHPDDYKNYKFCYLCDKKFPSLNELRSHMRTHEKEKLFQCSKCPAGFLDIRSLRLHQEIHSEDKFKCPLCEKSFSTFRYMIKHKNFVHVEFIPYKCRFCEETFRRLSTQRKHERIHTGEQKKSYKCYYCEKTFKQNHHKKRHEKTVHLKTDITDAKSKCSICEKVFTCPESVKMHHRRIHLKEKPHVCNFCDKKFTIPQELENHIRTHTKEKPYKCEICHRGFACKDNIRIHMPKHTKDRLYKCSLCEQDFKTARYRTLHIRNIHNNSCMIRTATSGSSKKKGNTTEKICKCSFCKKKLGNRTWRRETGETQHKCSVCQKSFRTNWYKGVHEKSHFVKKSPQGSNIGKNKSESTGNAKKIKLSYIGKNIPETTGSARTIQRSNLGKNTSKNTENATIQLSNLDKNASATIGTARARGRTPTGDLVHEMSHSVQNSFQRSNIAKNTSETTGSARTRGRTPTGEKGKQKPSTSVKQSSAAPRTRIRRVVGFQHIERVYSCTTCFKRFKTSKRLISHRRRHKRLRRVRVIMLRFA